MAEETRTKRLVDENQAEVIKYTDYAKKALEAGNENDARIFLTKKQELENVGAGLATSYASAHENAVKMRQMHDKLATDIETLKSRREMIKSKMAVAKTQETLNKATDSIASTKGAMSSFERMEEKADKMLDEANAMSELNMTPIDDRMARLVVKWIVKDPAGKNVGDIEQSNPVPLAAAKGSWAGFGDIVASAASEGVLQLLEQAINKPR